MTLIDGKWLSCGWTIEEDSFVEAAQIAEADEKFRIHSLSDNVVYQNRLMEVNNMNTPPE